MSTVTNEDLAKVAGLPSREAARILGVGKSTVNDARARARREGVRLPAAENLPDVVDRPLKILALDLENSPNLAHVWGLWNQNVSLKQLQESAQVICFGARWLGSDEVVFRSEFHHGRDNMLETAHFLMDEADAIMGWNSKNFDVKHLNREFYERGMTPPSPSKNLDLMVDVKSQFRFPSNKLDYVAGISGVGHKVQHSGHELWVRCMQGDPEAWEEMKEYQLQDVNLLIDLYYKLLPWLKSHPNYNLYAGTTASCNKCGSDDLRRAGFDYTGISAFPRFQCNNCGSWMKSNKRDHGASIVKV